jgi:hypothetical protein
MPEVLAADLLSDFARYNVDWLRRTTASRHAPLTEEEWSQLAIVCELFASISAKYRDYVHTFLERGMEARALRARLEPTLNFLGDAVRAMAELEEGGESASDKVRSFLERIRKAIAETESVKEFLDSLLTLAHIEPPPVPEDLLTAAEVGAFVRLDEFRKQK